MGDRKSTWDAMGAASGLLATLLFVIARLGDGLKEIPALLAAEK